MIVKRIAKKTDVGTAVAAGAIETAAVLRPEPETRARGMPNDYSGREKLLTKGEVAQLCRVEVRTIDRWLTAGKITCYRTPSGRVLFRRSDVLIAIEPKPATGRSADRGARPTPRPA